MRSDTFWVYQMQDRENIQYQTLVINVMQLTLINGACMVRLYSYIFLYSQMDPKMYAKKVEEFLSKKSWADSRTYKCDSVCAPWLTY